MNINSIIQGFSTYLEELNKTENGKYNTTGKNVSIFMYANEFKTYLAEKVKIDVPISSMTVNDILNMEIVNGKLTEEDELINPFEEENKEEDKPVSEKTDNEKKQASVIDVLNDLFNDDTVKQIIDTDKNEDFSKEEIADFLNIIKGLDENGEDISLEDILAAVIAIQDGTFDLLKTANEEPDTSTDIPVENTPVNTPSGTGSTGGTGGNNGGGSTGSSNIPATNNSPQTKTLDNMSKDELKSELTKAEATLTDKQNALSAILDGSDSEIQALEKTIEDNYDKYHDELEKLDKDMADQLDKYKETVDTKQDEVDKKEKEISDKEIEVSDFETAYNNAISNRDTLKGALDGLKETNTSGMSAEKASKVQSQINELENTKLPAAEQAVTDAKEKWDKSKEDLENLKTDKEKLDEDLKDANQDLTNYENEIHKKYPQLDTYKDDYEKSKAELETTKSTKKTEAQKAVTEAQAEVTKIKEAIQKAENKQTLQAYTPNEMSSLVKQALDLAISQVGVKEATGNNDGEVTKYGAGKGVAWCAAFVSWCYGKGQDGSNNNPLSFTAAVSGLRDQAIAAGYYSLATSYTPVPGDIMIQKENGSSHTGIVYACDGEYLYTIEGNSSNAVRKRKYKLGDFSKISGYVRMNEWSGGSANLSGSAYTSQMDGDTKERSTY